VSFYRLFGFSEVLTRRVVSSLFVIETLMLGEGNFAMLHWDFQRHSLASPDFAWLPLFMLSALICRALLAFRLTQLSDSKYLSENRRVKRVSLSTVDLQVGAKCGAPKP